MGVDAEVQPQIGARRPYRRRAPQWPGRLWTRFLAAPAVDRIAVSLVILQVGFRGWAGYGGYYSLDDFVFVSRAATSDLDLDYLLQEYNGHLMPGAFAWVWALTRAAPYDFGLVVTGSLLLQAAVSLVVYRLLRELFGARPGILLPLGVYLFSVVTLPAFLWWAAALNQLPMQLAMAVALWAHVRYLRTGRISTGLVAVAAIGGGLLFSEKTVLVAPLLVGFTVLYFAEGSTLRRITTTVRRHVQVWTVHVVLLAAYTWLYLSRVPSSERTAPSASSVVDLAGNMVGWALLPGLVGGPWSWEPVGFVDSGADPSEPARWISWALVLVVFEASILVGRRAVRAWVLLTGYVAGVIALVAAERLGELGPAIGLDYRYLTETALVATLCLGLAFLPLREAPENTRTRGRAAERLVAAVALPLYALSSTYSALQFTDRWHANPARPFLETARADIAAHDGPVTLADEPVPDDVVWPVLAPYNRPSRLLAPLDLDVGYRLPTDDLHALTPEGHLQPAAVPGVTNRPGPTPDCGWRVEDPGVTIPLTKPTLDWEWTVRIGYIANQPAHAFVTAGTVTTPVQFSKGLHALYVSGKGVVEEVRIEGLPAGTVLCTDEVSVGIPEAWPLPPADEPSGG